MSLPQITKQNQIQARKDVFLSEKQTLLMLPEVVENVSTNDMEIAQASVELPVRKYDEQSLVQKVGLLTKYICKDYGIVNADQTEFKYMAARFLSVLKRRYADLSLKEIKLAFELAAVGELDEWLPKDKHGNPDSKHYNNFNVEYYTKILNAYNSKRGKVWTNVKRALPKPQLVISEEERKHNKKVLIDDIYKSFDDYKEKGVYPNFIMTIFIQEFVNQGLLKEIQEPSKKNIEKAYRKKLESIGRSERRKMIDQFHAGVIDGMFMNDAQVIQNNAEIKKIYDDLIDSKKDIRTVLKC